MYYNYSKRVDTFSYNVYHFTISNFCVNSNCHFLHFMCLYCRQAIGVYCAISCQIKFMLCYVMLCYVMLCYAMLCYVMLCYAMLCYVMLCYVIYIYFSRLKECISYKCIVSLAILLLQQILFQMEVIKEYSIKFTKVFRRQNGYKYVIIIVHKYFVPKQTLRIT